MMPEEKPRRPTVEDLAALWVIERESAGVPDLVGVTCRIQRATAINPMIANWVISPVQGNNDARYANLFARIKPGVAYLRGDQAICSCGIVARKKP
jgi:hypothetical protein